MKKIIASIILTGLFFAGCDKVKHPDQRPPVIAHCTDSLTTIVNTNTLTSNTRKVLLEDYTGHTCPNCPRAAESAESLLASYPNNLIVIANHVTSTFAKPYTDTTYRYREDFRNASSTDWDNSNNGGFGISNAGLPKGMVNRVAPFPQNYSAWSSLVPAALVKPFVAKLDITSSYDFISHYLNVKVKTTFKKALTDTVNIVVLLTQDSIIANQKDNSTTLYQNDRDPNDPQTRIHYRFDHIVIDVINGSWGDMIKVSPNVNDTVTKAYNCYHLEKCFANIPINVCVNDHNVSVVAFIYSTGTKEILQVDKVKIR